MGFGAMTLYTAVCTMDDLQHLQYKYPRHVFTKFINQYVLCRKEIRTMGQSTSKSAKINKNHNRQKMFRLGISFGRNDLNLEGHLQMVYNSKTIKSYKPVENELSALMNNETETINNEQNERTESVEE